MDEAALQSWSAELKKQPGLQVQGPPAAKFYPLASPGFPSHLPVLSEQHPCEGGQAEKYWRG